MNEMHPGVSKFLMDGCMRCKLGGTPACKVHTWKEEIILLREIVLECGLTEDLKWGVPCYTLDGKNVLMISALKHTSTISFFKGSLMKDSKQWLVKPGENSQAARYLPFDNVEDLIKNRKHVKAYILEAIALEQEGKSVAFKKESEPVPEELKCIFKENPAFKNAFYQLTPGRQRGYLLFFSQPKQSATRTSRIEKCMPQIFQGKGMHDDYKK